MNSITQDTQYKQSVIKYSLKHGVTEAAIRYKEHRKTIYRWIARYDGTRESLVNKSRRPHHHPREHTKEEKELDFKTDFMHHIWFNKWEANLFTTI